MSGFLKAKALLALLTSLSPDAINSAKHMGSNQLKCLEQMNEGTNLGTNRPQIQTVFIIKIKHEQNNFILYPFRKNNKNLVNSRYLNIYFIYSLTVDYSNKN